MTVLTVPSTRPRGEAPPRRGLRVLGLAVATVHVVLGLAFERLAPLLGARSLPERSAEVSTRLTPAGWTFAAWGALYAASLAYGVYTLLPAQRRRGLHEALVRPFVAANVACVVWLVAFGRGAMLVAELALVAALASVVTAYVRARPHALGRALVGWAGVGFSAWLGWLIVATVAGTASTLAWAGAAPPSVEADRWAMVVLLGGTALVGWLAVRYADAVVPLIYGWGVAGIAAAQDGAEGGLRGVALVLVGVSGALAAAGALRARTHPSRAHVDGRAPGSHAAAVAASAARASDGRTIG